MGVKNGPKIGLKMGPKMGPPGAPRGGRPGGARGGPGGGFFGNHLLIIYRHLSRMGELLNTLRNATPGAPRGPPRPGGVPGGPPEPPRRGGFPGFPGVRPQPEIPPSGGVPGGASLTSPSSSAGPLAGGSQTLHSSLHCYALRCIAMRCIELRCIELHDDALPLSLTLSRRHHHH